MAAELVPFTSLLSGIVDNRGRTCPVAPSGIPLIATNCIRNDRLYPTNDTVRFVSRETYETWFRGHPRPGDLIFVTKGSPGRVCYSPDPIDFCIAQDMVAVRADERKVYGKYLFALLRSPVVQAQIENMHVGTLIPHFKKGDFDKLLLPVPDRRTQERIGDLYFLFSSKIELNRRMNETLESMARALFKSWFVAFDPVHAKAAGRQPLNLDPALAALFPDHFQDSELGPIPAGWRVVPLPEAIDVNPPRSLRRGQLATYLDMGNMPTQSARALATIQREFGSGMRFTNGDTLVARITPCLENGKTCFVDFLEDDGVGWGSTEFIVLRPKPPLPPEFAYLLARSDVFRSFAISQMTGSSGRQRVPAESLRHYNVVVPTAEIARSLGRFVRAMIAQMKCHDKESRTLAMARDALLPRLLSGELQTRAIPSVSRA